MPSPPTLCKYAKFKVKELIKKFIESDIYTNKEEFKKFRQMIHEALTPNFIDKFMNDLIAFYFEDLVGRKWLKRVTELLLSERTKVLKICSIRYQSSSDLFEDLYQRFVCFTIKMMKFHRVSLTHFELHCPTLGFSEFQSILPFLVNLKVLKLNTQSMSSNDFVGVILYNCKLLEHLEIVEPRVKISSDIIQFWPAHEKIRLLIFNINFDFYNITPQMTARVLKILPNLEIFGWKETALGILELAPAIPIKLTEVTFDSESNLATITQIHTHFPNITTIKLIHPQLELIGFLSNFTRLKNLTIHSLKPFEPFLTYFNNSGSRIQCLTLRMAIIELTLLLDACPNLIYLDLQNSSQIRLENIVVPHNLKYLFIKNSPRNVMLLLEGLRAIETLKIFSWMNFDPAFLDILLPNWANLKVLNVINANFFLPSCMQRIINSCHQLKEIYTLQFEWRTLYPEIVRKDIPPLVG